MASRSPWSLTLSTLSRALASWLADVLAPPACAACDVRLRRQAVFCPACASAVVTSGPRPAAGGVPLVAFALFGGPVAEALRRLKYGGRSDLAAPLGHLARRAARRAGLTADV